MRRLATTIVLSLAFLLAHRSLGAQGPIVAQIAASWHILALLSDGTVSAMGENRFNIQRREVLEKSGFDKSFPPKGVEIVDHYVMMGIGQVVVLRLPPDHLRILNRAIEQSAWGAFQTEFYITYDLAEARRTGDKSRHPLYKNR